MAPPPLLHRPKLKRGDQDYLDAFYSCSHSRQSSGMGGPNPILVSEVGAYLSLAGIDTKWERLKYLRIIQLLDSTFLAEAARKLQSQNKKPSR